MSKGRVPKTHQNLKEVGHIYLTDQGRKHKVTVPRHDPIRTRTLLSIVEQTGLTRNEFIDLLK
ncbi:MAG: type II toxin-antitoxin system HicA family toxin [Thaumarchaeota archaeon]|nr:type II toxin-antitoxin system HicA family toxin [Nitrososphaerota archaeon]